MRAVRFGGREVEIACGALTPHAYYLAFGSDGLMRSVGAVEAAMKSFSLGSFPALDLMRCAYAMAWTAWRASGAEPEGFEAWLSSLGEADLVTLAQAVTAEATAGLFRDAPLRAEKARQKKAGDGRPKRGAAEGAAAGKRQEAGA